MLISDEILSEQFLEIAGLYIFPKELICIFSFDVIERSVVIIEPGIKHIDSVHKSLGISSEICLPVAELA